MHKKVFVGLILALAVIFTFSVCFAADENHSMVNGVRNVMGGAENAMSDAAKGIGNGAKNVGNAVKSGAGAIGNTVEHGVNSLEKGMSEGNNNENNNDNMNNNDSNNYGNYDATRTSADNTAMGMNSTAWTWLILGVAAIAIIALVWYYSSQIKNDRNNDDE